jgi:hypothetical protein
MTRDKKNQWRPLPTGFLGCVPSQESSVEPVAFLVHTQINVSTPEEVLFFGTAAEQQPSQKRERAQLMEEGAT